tara:strand:- start:1292 stop:2347 length:1056 start_codon:yes stop_codon:yes gene_type:complete
MKRKNLIVKRKVDKKKFKISKIYNKFKTVISNNIGKKNFALGVSGGSDSLCLAYFSRLYSLKFGNKIHVLIVDHNLRKESSKEALEVKKILKKNKIRSSILTWKGKVPSSNIQANSRNIRYSLISNYCKKKKIKYLLTAHHADDQIENFFIRLFRGSGLTGLSSMSENVSYNDEMRVIRPFLNIKKNQLKFVTLNYFKTYIKDPSNEDEKFLRIKVRKYREKMKEEGFNTSNIVKTVNNLMLANKALNFYKNKALYKYVSFVNKNKCLVNQEILTNEAQEIIFKSFSDILSLVSGKYYPPRSKKIISLLKRLRGNKYNKSTLGGCVIEKKDSFLVISKETKAIKTIYQASK